MRDHAQFNRHVIASNALLDLDLLVNPDDDLDSTFQAYDLACQEWINVNGWLFEIEEP